MAASADETGMPAQTAQTFSQNASAPAVPLPVAPAPVAVNMLRKAFQDQGYGSTGLLAGLRNQFANRLKNDPDFVAGVLDQMKSEKDPNFLKLLAGEMAKNAACSRDLQAQMSVTAADGNESSERRGSALDILGNTFKPDAGLLQSMADLAQNDADLSVRLNAVDALGAWLKHSEQLSGMESQVVQQLVGIINATRDEHIRAHGLQALNGSGSRLSLEILQALPDLFQPSATPDNRALAAATFALADPAAKSFALEQLEKAFLQERDFATRQYIAGQMVTLGHLETYQRIRELVPQDDALLTQLQNYISYVSTATQ